MRRSGRFQKPAQLAAHGTIETFVHDERGDELLVWGVVDRGAVRLYASAQAAGANRFSPARLLSGQPVDPASVTARIGAGGEGIITWTSTLGVVTADVVKVGRS